MQCSVWPENVSMYDGRNLPCFPAYACLEDLIQLLAQARVLSGRHALSYFPPNPKQACKHLDPKYVTGHAG